MNQEVFIYIALILGIILLTICSYLYGYTAGKFKGARDAIDYCLEQREKELKELTDNLNK